MDVPPPGAPPTTEENRGMERWAEKMKLKPYHDLDLYYALFKLKSK
jgi:hypothetical protein